MGEDIGKVPLLAIPAVHSPKPIHDIPFCHTYFGIFLHCCEGVNDPAKAFPDLVDCSARCCFYRCVIYRIMEAAILEPKSERQIKDKPICLQFVGDCRYGQNLEFCRWVIFDSISFYNPGLLCPYFLLDFRHKVLERFRGQRRLVWGPRAIASSISKIDHGFLVCVGQPNLVQSKIISAAG